MAVYVSFPNHASVQDGWVETQVSLEFYCLMKINYNRNENYMIEKLESASINI